MSHTETKTIEVSVEDLVMMAAETKVANIKALKLTPTVHDTVRRFLDEKETLLNLVSALGSPLNVLFPDIIEENVQAFNNTFKKMGILGKVFFAHKCNQSDSIVRRLALTEGNIDVSSAG